MISEYNTIRVLLLVFGRLIRQPKSPNISDPGSIFTIIYGTKYITKGLVPKSEFIKQE